MEHIRQEELSESAIEKLNFINGHGSIRDFPHTQPPLEWVGAVLDLLEELGLDKLILWKYLR